MPLTTASKGWIERIRDALTDNILRPARLGPSAIAAIDQAVVSGDSITVNYDFRLDTGAGAIPYGYSVTISVKDIGGLPPGTTYRDVLQKLLTEAIAAKLE